MEVPERLDVTVDEDDPRVTVSLLGSRGHALVGGNGEDGYVFVRGTDGQERVRLDGRQGAIYAGGGGAAALVFLRKPSGASEAVTMRLDAGRGNIRAGGNGCDGDVLLFPEDCEDLMDESKATVWLDGRYGNIAIGGNGRDGDFLVFARDATISSTREEDATIWLNGDRGDIWLTGGLKPRGAPERPRALPDYSTNEGAVSSFEAEGRYGLIEFTHEHPSAPGDREKLRNIHVFCPLLHANSIVHATAHAGAPVNVMVSNMPRPDVSGGSGRFIDLQPTHKLNPGTEIKISYWIMN